MFKNRFTLVKNFLTCKNYLTSLPVEATIELTNHCNLDCIICPRKRMTRKKGFMDVSLFRKIISDLKETEIELVYLHGFGESLLHPDFFEMLNLAKTLGLTVGLSTNFTLLDRPDKIKKLIESGLDYLIVSLDSVNKTEYEKIRKNSQLKLILDNLEMFFKYKKLNKPPFVVIQMVNYINSVKPFNDIKKYFKDKPVEQLRIKEDLYNVYSSKNEIQKKRRIYNRSCYYLWRQIEIRYNGIVSPCCVDINDDIVVGDINKNTIREIWNSKLYLELRKKKLRDLYAKTIPCIECSFYQPHLLEIIISNFFNNLTLKKILPFVEKVKLTLIQ